MEKVMNKALTKPAERESRGWLDPFDSIYEDMDRFFANQFRRFPHIGFRAAGEGRLFANLDIGERGDEIVVELDAPGVKRDDIDITLTDNSLRIKGKRESRKEEKNETHHRVEREYGAFERRVALPCEVDADRIDAALKDGVLTVKLPKSAKAKEQERKIEIHT
jgi:HSP20 family protein